MRARHRIILQTKYYREPFHGNYLGNKESAYKRKIDCECIQEKEGNIATNQGNNR